MKKLNGRQTVPLPQEGGMREPTARFLVLRKKRQVHCSLQWSSLHGDRQVLKKKNKNKENLNNTVTEIFLQNDGRMDSLYKEKTISVLLSFELNKPV